MRRTAAIFLLLFSIAIPVIAKHAPLPQKLLNAKTVYIDNRSGYAVLMDQTYDELKKWGRFQIVEDPQKADVIFLLSSKVYVSGSYTTGNVSDSGNITANSYPTRVGFTYLTVVDSQTGASLWSDGKRWKLFSSATRGIVKELRKRVADQEAGK